MKSLIFILLAFTLIGCLNRHAGQSDGANVSFLLSPSDTFRFNSFVDCNMAEVWVGDTFRIFPGKYGEDPLWGNADDLKFADGLNPDETFLTDTSSFKKPALPPNAIPGTAGLHGAVWFETVYQHAGDPSGRTLYAIYHNENYPSTLPFNELDGSGYRDFLWPRGIKGKDSPAAVCRIGIMKSADGGRSWRNMGLFIEDPQPRMILKPYNTAMTFAGGVGDPSAVRSGDWLYLFYGEYGYPGKYDSLNYDPVKEKNGQCISVARIALADLDNPEGKAFRWSGSGFNAPFNGTGKPVPALQIQSGEGGGPASSENAGYYWGPSVSWNSYLNCWVMLMAKATGPTWKGSSIYISFNFSSDLGDDSNSQEWTKPRLLLDKPGYVLWYPSLQPVNDSENIRERYTSTRLGKKARLFVKFIQPLKSEYLSAYTLEFSLLKDNNKTQ